MTNNGYNLTEQLTAKSYERVLSVSKSMGVELEKLIEEGIKVEEGGGLYLRINEEDGGLEYIQKVKISKGDEIPSMYIGTNSVRYQGEYRGGIKISVEENGGEIIKVRYEDIYGKQKDSLELTEQLYGLGAVKGSEYTLKEVTVGDKGKVVLEAKGLKGIKETNEGFMIKNEIDTVKGVVDVIVERIEG